MAVLKLLDLYAGAGGAAMGYARAGFAVTGVDIAPQKHYPFTLVVADALDYLAEHGHEYDVIHASPPCQAYTALRTRQGGKAYPDLLPATRDALRASGRPWVIENVERAPLRPDIRLCGVMFGLRVYRHRWFEVSFPERLPLFCSPPHPRHERRVNRRGENRRAHWAAGGFLTVTGDVGRYVGPEGMGIDWMTGKDLSEAIPPAYTVWVGTVLRELLGAGDD